MGSIKEEGFKRTWPKKKASIEEWNTGKANKDARRRMGTRLVRVAQRIIKRSFRLCSQQLT